MYTFPPGKAATAADCSPALLTRWVETGVLQLRSGDIESAGQGAPRRFGERRVLQIAAARSLYSLGVTPSRAAAAALVWSDQGVPDLAPGAVYDNGETYLVVDDAGARIVHAPADATLKQVMETPAGWQPIAAVVLSLRPLRDRVLERLSVAREDHHHTPASLNFETKN